MPGPTSGPSRRASGSLPEPLVHPLRPPIEVVELLSSKLFRRNHVAAPAIAHHRLTGTKSIGDGYERNGRCAGEDAELARPLARRRDPPHVEPERSGIRQPDLVFAVNQRRAGVGPDDGRTGEDFDSVEVVDAVAEHA